MQNVACAAKITQIFWVENGIFTFTAQKQPAYWMQAVLYEKYLFYW